MEFSEDQVKKIKIIYQKQIEIDKDFKQKDKRAYIWNVGTDYFVHLSRLNYLFIYLLENYKLDLKNEEIFIEWKESLLTVQGKTKLENRYYLNIYKATKHETKYLISGNYIRKDEKWIFKTEDFFNEQKNLKNVLAFRTMHQFLEIGISLGYMQIKNNFTTGDLFCLLFKTEISNDYITDKVELASTFVDNYKNYFDFKYIIGNSVRDIFLSLHSIFLYELSKNNNLICSDVVVIIRKKKKSKIFFNSLLKTHKKSFSTFKKHCETQTTIKKIIEGNNYLTIKIFNILNDFLFEKYFNGWEVKNSTIQSELLEIYIRKNKGRVGQVLYRQLLLSDIKRYIITDEDKFINKNDLVLGMKIPVAIEASHIVPFATHNISKEEEYDPENGLLLDASIHTLFDQNKLIFDYDGNIWIEKENYKEIVYQIDSNHLEHSLIDSVLTPKTKKYLEKRISLKEIDFNEYQPFE